LVEFYETNLLSLVRPWLDNNYHKQTKSTTVSRNLFVHELNRASLKKTQRPIKHGEKIEGKETQVTEGEGISNLL